MGPAGLLATPALQRLDSPQADGAHFHLVGTLQGGGIVVRDAPHVKYGAIDCAQLVAFIADS